MTTRAIVKGIASDGLTIDLPDGSSGFVPCDEIFPGTAEPTFLTDLVYLSAVTIAVGQAIFVESLGGRTGCYSRKAAVNQALNGLQARDKVCVTVSEIRSGGIFATADAGYCVWLPWSETISSLEQQFTTPRLCPGPEYAPSEDTDREEQWLYVGDRVLVELSSDRAMRFIVPANLVLRGEHAPVKSHEMREPSSPASAPRTRYSEVLVVDDDMEAADSLYAYFAEGEAGYRTTWAADMVDVHRWLDDLSLRLHANPQAASPAVAVVRADSPLLPWLEVCECIGQGLAGADIALSLASERSRAIALEKQLLEGQHKFHVLGVWRHEFGQDALGAILTGQSALAGRFEPDQQRHTAAAKTMSQSADRPMRGVIRYRSCEDDVQSALDLLVDTAGTQANPCAAIIFRIHNRTHSVKILAARGDARIIDGFRSYESHLHKSPVRDLAIYRSRSDTDNANLDQAKYVYFLDAVGGPGSTLSVVGIRPTPPSRSPFCYAIFLISTKLAAFDQNSPLTKTVRRLARRMIETALTAQTLDEESLRLRRMAENAFDFAFIAHEAQDCLEYPADILNRAQKDTELRAADIADVRYGVVRARAVMSQLFPKKREGRRVDLETQDFQPVMVVNELFAICRKVVKAKMLDMHCRHRLSSAEQTFHGRALAFECAMRNLVLNAAQQIEEYCGGCGKISVGLGVRHEKTGATVLVATVSDNGPGIHGKYWEAVFEAGVSNRREGTGLGLPVSRRLMVNANGTLKLVDSLVYSGATFEVAMPVQVPEKVIV